MPVYSYEIAVGNDQTTLTNIEDVVDFAPMGTPVPRGSVVRQSLSRKQRVDGEIVVEWFWRLLEGAQFRTLMETYQGGLHNENQNVTIRTRSRGDVFILCNAIATLPVYEQDYTRTLYDRVENLTWRFRDVTPLEAANDGLRLENGLGLKLEDGSFLLME